MHLRILLTASSLPNSQVLYGGRGALGLRLRLPRNRTLTLELASLCCRFHLSLYERARPAKRQALNGSRSSTGLLFSSRRHYCQALSLNAASLSILKYLRV